MNREATQRLVAVVEDDALVAQTLTQLLGQYGFRSRWFRSGSDLLAHVVQAQPALCIVDLGLPDRDGLDLIRELQQRHDCGVLILTGRGFVSDKVLGLELGADDYMVKPFEPRELIARVRSILRRYEKGERAEGCKVAVFDQWRFDPASHVLCGPAGAEDLLGTAEAKLLKAFLESPNRILTREQLAGLDDLAPTDRSIDVRISRLRRRLRDDSHEPQLIKTVYGAGYLLAAAVRWESSQ